MEKSDGVHSEASKSDDIAVSPAEAYVNSKSTSIATYVANNDACLERTKAKLGSLTNKTSQCTTDDDSRAVGKKSIVATIVHHYDNKFRDMADTAHGQQKYLRKHSKAVSDNCIAFDEHTTRLEKCPRFRLISYLHPFLPCGKDKPNVHPWRSHEPEDRECQRPRRSSRNPLYNARLADTRKLDPLKPSKTCLYGP
ncbi:uncharacterized protein MYCGRDRAFT_97796 [Zymoseptoria tritici IPO323]|uniref:Uncharacterized protein n=1 Tax=Zymoseptoria tritici (strain CBS 115943 / IPO323) TaxID=336722 RepID=F9XRE4_ZYMTI|nr:uncharacterized protein MYCGRDRAFT_97796 [Zymoseptoria tritici IPO323]EGP82122.1 hypothetical protein MYCGRDRAFT_97796 [Zymoseptoria tritici IPO323]